MNENMSDFIWQEEIVEDINGGVTETTLDSIRLGDIISFGFLFAMGAVLIAGIVNAVNQPKGR